MKWLKKLLGKKVIEPEVMPMESNPPVPAVLCGIGAPYHGAGCNCANDRSQIVYGPGSEPREAPVPEKRLSVTGYVHGDKLQDGKWRSVVKMRLSCGCEVEQEEGAAQDSLQVALANHHCQKQERARRLRAVN